MTAEIPRPYTLIAELTHACPLRCGYCSNPVETAGQGPALATFDWMRVIAEADSLGVMAVHLTGGEPLLRKDLERIVAEASARGLYTQLVTSGVPLTQPRLRALHAAGLDCVQLSVQAAERKASDLIAGRESFDHKRQVARWVKAMGLPLTLNAVLHRGNIDTVDEIVALAERLSADRLELANAQYLGWALHHRAALLPSRQQLARARDAANRARDRLQGRMEVLFVLPDYHAGIARACMGGWARGYVVITPDGLVLPCQAARSIPQLRFDSVRERALGEIWRDGSALNAFRGERWMQSPCRTCEHRAADFGGCRCQAFALTGDAAAADPACAKSPHHEVVQGALRRVRTDHRSLPVHRV
jgi:pyrroloquinoline quinone biosynthesis protein E